MRRFPALTSSAVLAAALVASVRTPAGASPAAKVDQQIASYYAELMRAHPTTATERGIHDYDDRLESFAPETIAAEMARLRRWDQVFSAEEKSSVPPTLADDVAMLRLGIAHYLVEGEDVQRWRRLADFYPSYASNALYVLIKRDFAPLEKRLEAAILREKQIPALLEQGKKNLKGVSPVAVDIALEEIEGIRDFFTKDVPLAFVGVRDGARLAELGRATEKTVAALADYRDFLRRELRPRANAPIAIGEASFRKKLAADEMVTTPLDELLARGEAELARLQGEFRALAARIDPKRSPQAVQDDMQRDHPAAGALLAETQGQLASLRKFVIDHDLVGVPSETLPRVEETPAFMRATTLASMDTPGNFETRATEAYYHVTLPDPSWTSAQAEDFLRGAFSRPVLQITSIHEAFPGHYLQFIWLPHLKSVVRRHESVDTNVEGWAHYCEQLMLDEGWGAGNPKLRLAQLQDALLRAARYVVSIRMHTRGMTYPQAIAFFVEQGFQSQKVAEMESRRGTEDPTYLYYTLGKLEILRLRDDYKKKLGGAFTLRKFHDAFLAQGPLPIAMIRKVMLGVP